MTGHKVIAIDDRSETRMHSFDAKFPKTEHISIIFVTNKTEIMTKMAST